MNPDISIIIPVYNTEKYINKCIDSVLSQTIKNIEIIIIDDASADNSLKIIKEYKKKDIRIKVIALKDNTSGGAGIPSNIGILEAKGKYIGFVDSDDWIDPEMFEVLYENALENDSDYAFCDFFLVNEKNGKISCPNDRCHWENINTSNKSSLFKLSPVPWRKLYKRSFLIENNLRFPEGDYFYEDTPFHHMVCMKAEKVSFVDKPLYYHLVSRAEQTMSGNGIKFFAFLEHFKTIYEFMKKEDYIQYYFNDFLIMIINNYYWIWDRLNSNEQKKFFFKLSQFINIFDKNKIDDFTAGSIKWDSIRLEQLYKGDYRKYKRTMMKFKTKTGILLRGLDYFKENGLIETIKRIS